MKTMIFDKLPSTNDYLKRHKFKEDAVIIAEVQTGGRGTKGRSFSSERGGAYLSMLKNYPCEAKNAFIIMQHSALAVVKTLSAFDISAKIKWPNDIFVNGKKICGILIENSFEGEKVSRSIVGVGLNVNNDLPEELRQIATSMKEVLGKELPLDTIRATLIYNLALPMRLNGSDEYKRHSLVLGNKITVIKGQETFQAVAKDILLDGRLLLEDGQVLSSAEISIK